MKNNTETFVSVRLTKDQWNRFEQMAWYIANIFPKEAFPLGERDLDAMILLLKKMIESIFQKGEVDLQEGE